MQVEIRYDNSKNRDGLQGIILADPGGATARVQLANRQRPIIVHKRHMFIHKNSKEYDVFFNKYKTNSCVHYKSDTPVALENLPAVTGAEEEVSRTMIGDHSSEAGPQNDAGASEPIQEAPRIEKFPEREPARYNLRPRRQ